MRKLFVMLGILAALAVGSPVYATEESTPPSAPVSSAPVDDPTPSSSAPTSAPASPRPDCLAYYYTGTRQTLCDRFPRNTKLTCAEAKYRVTLRGKLDPWGLDGGGANIGVKGVGCESNPLKPRPTPTGTRTTSPAVSGPSLPLTGPGGAVLAIGGVVVLALGGLAVYLTTRRRNKFVA